MRKLFNKIAGCAGVHTGGVLSEAEQFLAAKGAKYRKKWDGTILLKGDLRVEDKNMTALPDFSNVIVMGSFVCMDLRLTSLKGSPKRVEGSFHCSGNPLTTLEGAPQYVGDGVFCDGCGLESLEGGPKHVGRDFYCGKNRLKTLHGAPQFVGNNFNCENNELVSLEGAPEKTGGLFWCGHNKLPSLKGAPRIVGDSFWCQDNQLTSLKDGPDRVGTTISCSDNKITSLIGMPQKFTELYAERNPLEWFEGAPEKTNVRLRSDFGDFYNWNAVPEDRCFPPETRALREHERATMLQAPLRISKPLRLRA